MSIPKASARQVRSACCVQMDKGLRMMMPERKCLQASARRAENLQKKNDFTHPFGCVSKLDNARNDISIRICAQCCKAGPAVRCCRPPGKPYAKCGYCVKHHNKREPVSRFMIQGFGDMILGLDDMILSVISLGETCGVRPAVLCWRSRCLCTSASGSKC